MSVFTEKYVSQKLHTQSLFPIHRSKTNVPFGLCEIGRPIGIRSSLDYNGLLRNKILSKMSIIDLIPVKAEVQYMKAGEAIVHGDVSAPKIVSSLVPRVEYNEAISRYARLCQLYGLPPYGGIRLYIVDESTVVDEIRHEFSENIFQGFANRISQTQQELKQLGRSLSTQFDTSVDKAVKDVTSFLQDLPGIGSLMKTETGKVIKNVAESIGKIAAKGTRISLPRIWADSSYTMQSSCVVRLVSPYGHPKAIMNYVAKPLLALLLLSSAVSADGISYGYPMTLTINAYGLGQMTLGTIDSIVIRRGGNDTSFNRYRQPLSVDVSITFITLIGGYAALEHRDPNEHGVLKKFTRFVNGVDLHSGKLSLLNTPGKLINSLRPTNLVNYQSDMDRGFLSIDRKVLTRFSGVSLETPPFITGSENVQNPVTAAASEVISEITKSAVSTIEEIEEDLEDLGIL